VSERVACGLELLGYYRAGLKKQQGICHFARSRLAVQMQALEILRSAPSTLASVWVELRIPEPGFGDTTLIGPLYWGVSRLDISNRSLNYSGFTSSRAIQDIHWWCRRQGGRRNPPLERAQHLRQPLLLELRESNRSGSITVRIP